MVTKKMELKNREEECVREIAEELKKEKWEVKANLEGFEKPPKIAGYTPAIAAEKGSLRHICEVVTEEMFKGDKTRYIELKNYCDEYDFHFYIIDKEGKRKEIDLNNISEK